MNTRPWPRPRFPRGRLLLKVFLALCGGVALLIGGASILHTLSERAQDRERPSVRTAAVEFLDRLASGKIAEARTSATPAFQRNADEANLKAFVARHPPFFSPNSRVDNSIYFMDGTVEDGGRAEATFWHEGGVVYAMTSVFLVKIDGRWVVDGVSLLVEGPKIEALNVRR